MYRSLIDLASDKIWRENAQITLTFNTCGRRTKMSSPWPNVSMTIVVVLGIIVCLAIIATRDLNNTETLLLSLVLTILSLFGSWVASRHYSEVSFNNNLRVFALKAAEKVNNLSNELDRLSVFLQQELGTTDNIAPNDALLSKEASIEAAIHIISTLKSVNDTSLSDWQGVIGEELNARKEAREEREEDLRELVDWIESVSLQIADSQSVRDNTSVVLSEVNAIKSDLRTLASQVSGVPVRRPKVSRQSLEIACPRCSSVLRYDQKAKEGGYKVVTCQECKSKLLSSYKNGAFVINANEPQPVHAACPSCNTELFAKLELPLGRSVIVDCPNCMRNVRLVRAKGEVRARVVNPTTEQANANDLVEVDEDILNRVKVGMPPQPWPKGAAKEVASKLGLSNNVMAKAIMELVNRGSFKMQVEGKLYEPINSAPESDRN